MAINPDKKIKTLQLIIDDCETDVEEFDGKEFNGKTLGEMHGRLEAKIQAIAEILKDIIEHK